MLVLTLRSFSQSTDSVAPVYCEVVFEDADKGISGSIACPPIEGLGGSWTNEDLASACSKALGKTVELPAEVKPAAKAVVAEPVLFDRI